MSTKNTTRHLLNVPRAALAAGVSLAKATPIRAMQVAHHIAGRATQTQIELAYSKSLRVMREIRKRASAPFRSSAPGPDSDASSVYPPILSRL